MIFTPVLKQLIEIVPGYYWLVRFNVIISCCGGAGSWRDCWCGMKGVQGTKINRRRLHSSGMRTARLLTVSQHALCRGCVPPKGCVPAGWCVPAEGCTCLGAVYLPRGVYLPGGVPAQGVYLLGRVGHTCQGVSAPGGVCLPLVPGVSAPGWCLPLVLGGLLLGGHLPLVPGGLLLGGVYPNMQWGRPPVNRMTNRCKNITLPQTSFAGLKNLIAW